MKAVVAILTVGAVLGAGACAQELRRMGLDDLSTLGLKLQADTAVKAEGSGSLRVTTLWPTTVCLGEVAGLQIESGRLVYTAKVKSDLSAGEAYLELWVQTAAGEEFFAKGMDNPVQGRMDWRLLSASFVPKKIGRLRKATMNLVVNGKGTVWVDDVRLAKESLK